MLFTLQQLDDTAAFNYTNKSLFGFGFLSVDTLTTHLFYLLARRRLIVMSGRGRKAVSLSAEHNELHVATLPSVFALMSSLTMGLDFNIKPSLSFCHSSRLHLVCLCIAVTTGWEKQTRVLSVGENTTTVYRRTINRANAGTSFSNNQAPHPGMDRLYWDR